MEIGRGPELKAFLRKMRARLGPENVGLPAGGRRRRTPGLRIEEAAALAGVSLTWYAALESGKGVRVSANLLERVATALRLNSEERELLVVLAAAPSDARTAPSGHPVLQTIVDGFGKGPALVADRFWNIRAYNALADAVYGLSVASEPNLLARMLLETELRELHEEWERIARLMVAILHLSYGYTPDDPVALALIARLRAASGEFVAWWDDYTLQRFEPTVTHLRHPTLGRLALTFTSFVSSSIRSGDNTDVLMLQPAADERTLRQFQLLSAPLGAGSL